VPVSGAADASMLGTVGEDSGAARAGAGAWGPRRSPLPTFTAPAPAVRSSAEPFGSGAAG